MKKIVFFAFICVMTFAHISAQDTVRYGDSCYLFNSVDINNLIPVEDHNHNACAWQNGYLDGYEYQLQKHTNIYGIAATIRRDNHDEDSAGYTMYLCTTLNGTDLLIIDSASRYSRETHYVYMAMEGNNVIETTVPCYEYYFSQPHNFQGTIYIGSKFDRNFFQYGDFYYLTPCLNVSYDRSLGQKWIKIDTTNPIQILESRGFFWGGYFPIIQPEPIECTAERVKVTERWEDHVVLEWDMEGDSCQLSITPYGMPIDSGIVVGLQTGSYTVTDLDSGVYYVARLKTLCHHHCPIHADMPVWSDWGSPTIIPLGNQGINTTKTTPKWSLTPNPAHGSVTVQCDEGIMEVEIISMKGESLQHHNAAGAQSCAIDLTGLNKGIYIVQITTPQGTAARKLAVE